MMRADAFVGFSVAVIKQLPNYLGGIKEIYFIFYFQVNGCGSLNVLASIISQGVVLLGGMASLGWIWPC